jgi:hypothetical protein
MVKILPPSSNFWTVFVPRLMIRPPQLIFDTCYKEKMMYNIQLHYAKLHVHKSQPSSSI